MDMAFWESDPAGIYLRYPPEKLIKEQNRPYDSKKDLWIPDEAEGYVAATLRYTKGDLVTVMTKLSGKEQVLKKELTQEMNPPKFEKSEDMANLTFLNEASVLHNLKSRYKAMLIYTYSGLFCVAINPYKRLPIYAELVVKMYMGRRRGEVPPHLFSVADEAYRNVIQENENQSILITGESGAGKTENTKKVVAYFALVGASQTVTAKETSATSKATLEEQIVQTNPVLEAFGNAKTVRNNNSSRFGKFIRVHFDKRGKMAGGDIEHYLLEKSRVIHQAAGERSYHIFYQIMSAYSQILKQTLKLDKDLKGYRFVSQAELSIDGVDDKEEMRFTDEAFNVLGFSSEEKLEIYKVCAGILHMGEMKFKQRPREDQAEVDGTDEAEKACEMFAVKYDDYLKAIMKPRVKVGSEWVNKGQNLEQVKWGIGAMAKGIYSRLFHWLVKRCNQTLCSKKDVAKDHYIGVLDIAGFEIFDLNSFEQLWINFVNEKLQQFFNHHMFVLEQEEYQREGINWQFTDFGLDLQATIDLIEKPLGIVSMLDEECIVPKATDQTYATKLNTQHLGKHANFEKPKAPKGKQTEAHFAIKHYAGTVRYNTSGWLEKNKDPLNDTCVQVMKTQSSNKLLVEIWKDFVTQDELVDAAKGKDGAKKKGKSAAFNTVSMINRESLSNLIAMLCMTHPHFVRCIIPNELKKSGVIDSALVMNQLTCNGVLEGIRICRKGFPNRMLHSDFKFRYSILAREEAKSSPEAKVCSQNVLNKLSKTGALTDEDYTLGQTKVFFKAGVLAQLEDLRDSKLSELIKGLQAQVRWHIQQKETRRLQQLRAAQLMVQRNVRILLDINNWKWLQMFRKVKELYIANEFIAIQDKLKEVEERLKKESKLRAELQKQVDRQEAEKDEIFGRLQSEKDRFGEFSEVVDKFAEQQRKLETICNERSSKLVIEEESCDLLCKEKKAAEQQLQSLKQRQLELEMLLRKAQMDHQAKELCIKNLTEEMFQQDQLISKTNKEKKQQEALFNRMNTDLETEQDKVRHVSKVLAKLEQSYNEFDELLEQQRKLHAENEKQKRKTEGELRVCLEHLDERIKQKQDVQTAICKKDLELSAVSNKLENEQSLISKLRKTIKELEGRVQEFEEQLVCDRQARAKIEKTRCEVQEELEELAERLEDADGSISVQNEMLKKRDALMSQLRREFEETKLTNETQLSHLRKKQADATAEMTTQMEQLNRAKTKLESEKAMLQQEINDMNNAIDAVTKTRMASEKFVKELELKVMDMSLKVDNEVRILHEQCGQKTKMIDENSAVSRQLDEAEAEIATLNRVKQQLQQQVSESKRNNDEMARERESLTMRLRHVQSELQSLENILSDETEAKTEVQRQILKTRSELQHWRDKTETEAAIKSEELADERQRLSVRMDELNAELAQATQKIAILDKGRKRLLQELDDSQVELERINATALQLDRKQRGFNNVVEDLKRKCEDLRAELEASQRENRTLTTELLRLKTEEEENKEQLEALQWENKNLAQEINGISDQLGTGGRSAHELMKLVRRLELEKEELQIGLVEAENVLEAEESKLLRTQLENNQVRADGEKRFAEKEKDFESTRRNHQKALDSMQATLECESKSRADLLRQKAKLESDINSLEIASEKTMKRHQELVKELQVQVDEEQRCREELKDQLHLAERRCHSLQAEIDELKHNVDTVERIWKQMDEEATTTKEELGIQSAMNSSLLTLKRRAELELQSLHDDIDESTTNLKRSEDEFRKWSIETAKLTDELHQEQEHSLIVERQKRMLEDECRSMQSRLQQAEDAMVKSDKAIILKLEQKVRDLETEHQNENRKASVAQKTVASNERRIRELQFQLEDAKKANERCQQKVSNLQQQIKAHRRQLDDAEDLVAVDLSKLRSLQRQLEDADERAGIAEAALTKLKCKNIFRDRVLSGGSSVAALLSKSASTSNIGNLRIAPLLRD